MSDETDQNTAHAMRALFEALLFLRVNVLEGTPFGPGTRETVDQILDGPDDIVKPRLLAHLMAMRELAFELVLMRQRDTGTEPEETLREMLLAFRQRTEGE